MTLLICRTLALLSRRTLALLADRLMSRSALVCAERNIWMDRMTAGAADASRSVRQSAEASWAPSQPQKRSGYTNVVRPQSARPSWRSPRAG